MAGHFQRTILHCTGLTMGFVSMDPTYIEILQRSGTDAQKNQAARVKPFVLRHHLTLVRAAALPLAFTVPEPTGPTH